MSQTTEQTNPEGEAFSRSNDAVANALLGRDNAADLLPDETALDLIDYVEACFDMSHRAISPRYDHWREAEQTHDVYVPAYIESRSKQRNTGARRPRIIDTIRVPYARAISDTIATYNLAIFGGARPFHIEPVSGKGSRLGAKIVEAELAANMRRIGFETKVYQMSVDQNRYGLAPTALYWGEDGNSIISVDPWGYFPDPRVGAQSRHEAEFLGLRSTASTSALYRRGLYKNLHKLEQSSETFGWAANRESSPVIRGQNVEALIERKPREGGGARKWSLTNSHVLNSLYVWMHPKQFNIPAPFGLYRIVVADEKTIILFDKSPYPHGKIPVLHGDALYDAHKMFGSGSYDLMMPLQRFQDWLLRSRVENVQTIVQSRLIVDPTRININDILVPNSARLVRTLPGANPKDAMIPVNVPDATSRYWQDIGMSGDLMQRLTSASDTAQGVQSETNKTATEISRLTALGQQRLGTQARLTSAHTMRPLARMMVRNTQYFGTAGGVVPLPASMAMVDEDGLFRWRPEDIMGEYDYQVSDGTLPISPQENTENLIRAIRALTETGMSAEYDMQMFTDRLIESFGFSDLDNWKLDPTKAKQRAAAMARQSVPGVEVTPNETIMKAAEAGDIIPMGEAMKQFPDAVPGSPTP